MTRTVEMRLGMSVYWVALTEASDGIWEAAWKQAGTEQAACGADPGKALSAARAEARRIEATWDDRPALPTGAWYRDAHGTLTQLVRIEGRDLGQFGIVTFAVARTFYGSEVSQRLDAWCADKTLATPVEIAEAQAESLRVAAHMAAHVDTATEGT